MTDNKVIAMLNCHDDDVFCFRKEIIDDLADNGYTVLVSCPYGKRIEFIKRKNVIYEDIEIDRRGTNPIKDLKLLRSYVNLFKKYKPLVVLAFTIKPNIYGGLAARHLKIPYVNNITGLGSGFENGGIVKRIIVLLYRVVFNSAYHIFFQNEENRKKIQSANIIKHDRYEVIPGSGVNLRKFAFCEYPKEGTIVFNYIGRVMRDKNIDDYLYLAEKIKEKYSNITFNVIGFIEETESEYRDKLKELEDKGIIRYLGSQQDVRPFIDQSCAIVHPSTYGEGLSNVLLESASVGRALITTTISGCRETVDDGVNGYLFEPNNRNMMIDAVEKFISLTYKEKVQMGIASRKIAETHFSRDIVVEKYRHLVEKIWKEEV
ncbi:MAG: glycosyltransferase family 4 protein [Acetatifactor sp.]|nr:glycosyltransferase family 4 protein [Acetatifactor sp.]